jgi:hypothetical protein
VRSTRLPVRASAWLLAALILAGCAVAGPPAPGGAPAGPTGGAVPAVDAYLGGLAHFDAGPVLGALSDDLLASFAAHGADRAAVQAALDDARARGAH